MERRVAAMIVRTITRTKPLKMDQRPFFTLVQREGGAANAAAARALAAFSGCLMSMPLWVSLLLVLFSGFAFAPGVDERLREATAGTMVSGSWLLVLETVKGQAGAGNL